MYQGLKIANYPYTQRLVQFGLTAIFANHVADYLCRVLPPKLFHPNWITGFNLILATTVVPLAYFQKLHVLGIVILFIILFDNMDGYFARTWGTTSIFGQFFDSFADYFFYACLILGTYLIEKNILSVIILAVYTLIVNFRLHFLRIYKANQNLEPSRGHVRPRHGIKFFISYLVGHNDVMCALAVILIYYPSWIPYWLMYELGRRSLTLVFEVRKLLKLYL